MPPSPVPYQCLSCRLSRLFIAPSRRHFHASTTTRSRKPAYQNVKASDLGLVQAATAKASPVRTQPYTEREKELLAGKYTEEQMAIIELGEDAIPAEDLERQAVRRTDPIRISYFDDFSTHRPIIDSLPEGATEQDALDMAKARASSGRQEKVDPDEAKEAQGLALLSRQSGLSTAYIKSLRTKNLLLNRVTNQTRMGKVNSWYVISIAGNEDGLLGIGEGKAVELTDAIRQSEFSAIRFMKPILRYENRTIFGDVEGKVSASVVQLQARPPGFGNRCQHLIFEMARAAGIHDIAARTPRSRNKMNVIKAAYKALLSQRDPEDVAKARGRKMVDVRKVYYAGSVP